MGDDEARVEVVAEEYEEGCQAAHAVEVGGGRGGFGGNGGLVWEAGLYEGGEEEDGGSQEGGAEAG